MSYCIAFPVLFLELSNGEIRISCVVHEESKGIRLTTWNVFEITLLANHGKQKLTNNLCLMNSLLLITV